MIHFQARLSLAGHKPQKPRPCSSFLTSPGTLAAQVRCRYCKARAEAAALQEWPPQGCTIPSPKNCSAIVQVLKCPGCSTSTVLESNCLVNSSVGEKKAFPTQKPFREVTAAGGQEPCLHFSSAIHLLLQEKALPARGLLLCPPSLRVFPCAGQAAKQAQQAPLAAAGVPCCAGLPPRRLGY